jgi:hypothetical protein
LWMGGLNIVKMAIHSNWSADKTQSVLELQLPIHSNTQASPQIHMQLQGTPK